MNNDGAELLFLTKPSQEAHRWSTQQLRWFRQEQKDKTRMFKLFHARSLRNAATTASPIADVLTVWVLGDAISAVRNPLFKA